MKFCVHNVSVQIAIHFCNNFYQHYENVSTLADFFSIPAIGREEEEKNEDENKSQTWKKDTNSPQNG